MDEAISGLPMTIDGRPLHITLPAVGVLVL